MNVNITYESQKLTAKLQGEIDHHSAAPIRKAIDAEIQLSKPQTVILDFSGVTFMDSSGIGLIMGRYRLAQIIKAEIKVVNIPQNLLRMIKLSGIEALGIIKYDKAVAK
ncbi:MAG: anti-sigma factor antagonist [Clostridiales bacterium]|nr:anti-sigma factor antagonist [Clostridiales bacterium]